MTNINYQPKDYAGKLAKYFIRSPITTILGVFLLMIGYISLLVMPREENPQMVISGSTVIIALPGATANEVENVIVKPLERKLKEVKGIEHIYGIAMDSVAVVNTTFFIGEEKEDSNLKIYDKIMQNMNIFPRGVMMPIIKPLDIDVDIPVISVAFYSKDGNLSKTELYDKVKDIQHQVNGLPNVAVTNLKGGSRHQFNILVDLNKLSGYNLSMGQIVQAVQGLAYNIPDSKTRTESGEIIMMGVKNAIEDADDIGNIIVAQYMGSSIHLKDIAKIEKSHDIQNFQKACLTFRDDDGNFVDKQCQVTLTVSKLQGTNAVVIANAVKEELVKHKASFEADGIGFVITRNDGERANEAVNELVYHLILSIVIIAVLLIFVLGWRESLIVTFTVPAILAVTIFVAYLTDQTINRITLFAFLLSLGLLVDAAIIVIENIHRHLHSKESEGKDLDELMVEATDEIGPPTNIATFAIILTMVPMAFVGQMMGQFMQPIPANVPVALIASLFVAYIFTPYLAVRMLKRPKGDKH
jgi:multidrug efflux pump subunit AcrB